MTQALDEVAQGRMRAGIGQTELECQPLDLPPNQDMSGLGDR